MGYRLQVLEMEQEEDYGWNQGQEQHWDQSINNQVHGTQARGGVTYIMWKHCVTD